MWTQMMTKATIARGRFTSPVGAGRIAPDEPGCIDVGRKSSQLQIRRNKKQRRAEGHESMALRADRGIGEFADLFDQDLPDQLQFARYPGGRLLAHGKTEQEEDHRGDDRGENDVVVRR